ncbi:MAG TPA: hypothetical protein DEO95_11145, partial [Ruminococcaceae bacterium]|nr:hypothetical protein [Oscillospiraceae bacterium]
KDEVTNRLTASANYGVSAIENYVPPKQFTPGQTVKKEEAVVNTGSIDAFVKQKITGDMKVSVEVPTVTAPDKDTGATQNYLELDSQERFGTYEAGSTLAWAPDGSKYRQGDKMKDGGLIIDYGIDGTTATNNDFNPDKTGLYIFRRAIVKNDNNEATNYEYVGYYYVEETDKYYKLYALTVPKTILDEDSDGLLKGTPTVSYSRKIETDIQKVDMTFLEPTDTDADGNQYGDYRLKVQYSTDDIVNGEVANEARKANAQQVYDNYNAYLDYLQGATTYVPTNSWTYAATTPRATDLRAHDASNPSGLIDHDIYLNQSADTKNPDNASLTNFSYRRLEDLKYGNYGQTSYDTAATDGARVFVTKKDGSDTSTTVADSAKKGLMGLYNYYSPVMNAYNSVYGAFTPYDSTTAGGGVNSATVPTTVQGAWDAAQNEANRSRQLINTGINAAADLATVKSEVETAIGRDYSGTATTSGLKLTRSGATTEDPVGTNTWEANNVYTDALTNGDHYAYNENGQAPLVAFNSETTPTDTNLIAFAKTSAGLDTADKIQEVLSADTVFEERFKDVADGNFGAATGAGSQVKFTVDESNRPASSGTLKTKWDAYVAQTKRKMLIDKKIELVQSCIQNTNGVALPGADITVSETDAARDIEEAQRALVLLKKEKAEIMVDYNKAEKDYQDASKAVADKIKKMNELQRMVDAANKEYISDLNGVNKLQTTAAANDFYYPTSNPTNETGDAIITTVTKGGVADSPVETILKNCLTNTYGVAHKADAPAPTYTSATNPAIYQTYSQAQTKTDIDKYTTANDNGTTTFDVPTAGFNTSEFQHDGTEDATETAVKNAPYFRLNQADNMMTYRKKQADDKKAAFDAAAAQMALFDADETSSSEGIVLYIGLGDVFYNVPNIAPTEDTDEHKWMY